MDVLGQMKGGSWDGVAAVVLGSNIWGGRSSGLRHTRSGGRHNSDTGSGMRWVPIMGSLALVSAVRSGQG